MNRPATADSFVQSGFKSEAVGDMLELSGHEFEARYRHIQQLEYIRRCRVRPRGPQSQMRLLISPFGLQDVEHYPRESKRGLPIRKGVNRSLDKLRPLSPEMHHDFGIMPNSLAQVRSEFGYKHIKPPPAATPRTAEVVNFLLSVVRDSKTPRNKNRTY